MNIVKKILSLFLEASLVLMLFGCATPQEFINPQTGEVSRNLDVDAATPAAVAINGAGGAAVGCVLGGLAGAAGGNPAGGCAFGAAAGGMVGAASTQRRTIVQSPPQVIETYPQQQQGYASGQQPSQCTNEYRLAEQEITAIVARKQQETANYLSSTNDREGAAKISDQTATWQTQSKNTILIRYRNCIATITSEPQQYAPQQAIIQQPPTVYSQPAISFPQAYPYGGYGYPFYPYDYGYYYNPYHGHGRYGWR